MALTALLVAAWPAVAQTPAEPGTPPPSPPPPAASAPEGTPPGDSPPADAGLADAAIDLTQRQARSSMEWLARGVDGWFGDIPFSKGGRVTDGELGWSVFKRTDQSPSQAFRFKARFHLPNVEASRYIFIGNDDKREVLTDRPDTFSRQQQLLRGEARDNSFFAGVGTAVRETIDLRVGFRGGLKPYAQARYRQGWAFGNAERVEFRETLFYSLSDRLGSTTALSLEHTQTPTLAFRWLNVATATQRSKDFAWSSSLGAYQSFGEERLLTGEAVWNGVVGDSVTVADYGLQAKWRQPLHRNVLIGELLVGHFWPKPSPDAPRGRAWAIGFDMRLKF
jgi:hypothetical protein